MITKKHSYFRGDKIDSDDGCIKSVNTLKIIKLSDLNWWAVLSHNKEPIWLSSNEVDEPRAYYTEISQKEKDKYCILMHICEIWRDSIDEPVCRAAVDTQT